MAAIYIPKPERCIIAYNIGVGALERDTCDTDRDYNSKDPRTWPLVKETHFDVSRNERRCQPATRVAYERERAKSFLSLPGMFPTRIVPYTSFEHSLGGINRKFYCWPFNFTQGGTLREQVGIPKDDFEYWMKYVRGPGWIEESQRDREALTLAETSSTEQAVTESPTSTYDRIIQKLAEQKGSASKIAELVAKLQASEERYQKESKRADQNYSELQLHRSRADKAEISITILNKTVTDANLAQQCLRDEITHLRKNISNESSRANKAEAQVRCQSETVKKQKRELEGAKKEAGEANERIEMIWKEMQAVEEGGKGKRKADVKAGKGQKKAKVND